MVSLFLTFFKKMYIISNNKFLLYWGDLMLNKEEVTEEVLNRIKNELRELNELSYDEIYDKLKSWVPWHYLDLKLFVGDNKELSTKLTAAGDVRIAETINMNYFSKIDENTNIFEFFSELEKNYNEADRLRNIMRALDIRTSLEDSPLLSDIEFITLLNAYREYILYKNEYVIRGKSFSSIICAEKQNENMSKKIK